MSAFRFRTLPGIVGGYSVYEGSVLVGTVKPVMTESVSLSATRREYVRSERWQYRLTGESTWCGASKTRKDACIALDFAVRSKAHIAARATGTSSS